MLLTFISIDPETFLSELARAEKYFSEAGKFVGLSHFIKGHLGPMGFDYRESVKIAVALQASGKIEFYKVPPPAYAVEVTAIRLKQSGEDKANLPPAPAIRSFRRPLRKRSSNIPLLISRKTGCANFAENQR